MADIAQLGIEIDTRKLKSGEKDLASFASTADKTSSVVATATKAIATMAAAFATSQIIKAADAYSMMNARVSRFTDSAESATAVMRSLTNYANAAGAEVGSAVAVFTSLSGALQDVGTSQTDILRLTETLNKLGVIGGSSADEVSNALRQFAQSMAGGVVRAEEFNSIIENTPEIARAIGAGMNLSMGQLRTAMLNGQLTSEAVLNSLMSQTETVDAQFAKMPRTVSAAMQTMENEFGGLIGVLNNSTGATSTLAWGIDALSGALVTAKDHTSEIITVAEALAAVYAARLVGGVASSSAAMKLFNGIMALTSATTATAIVRTDSLGMAYTTVAAKATASAVALRAANSVMGALGGPAGVAMLAATAIYYFYQRSQEATQQALEFASSVDTTTQALRSMTPVAAAAANAKLSLALQEQEESAADLRDELQALEDKYRSGTSASGNYQLSQSQLADLQNQIAIKAGEVEEAENKVSQTRSKQQALTALLNGTLRENYVLMQNSNSVTGIAAGIQNVFAWSLNTGNQALATRNEYVTRLNNITTKAGQAALLSIKQQIALEKAQGVERARLAAQFEAQNKGYSSAETKQFISDSEELYYAQQKNITAKKQDSTASKAAALENKKITASQYVDELKMLADTQSSKTQAITKWEDDNLNKLKLYRKHGLITESDYSFGIEAIKKESNSRMKALDDERWNAYLGKSKGALTQLFADQKAAQALTGAKGDIVRSNIKSDIKSATFEGLPKIDAGSQTNEQNQIAQLQTQTTAMNDAYNQRIEQYKAYRALEVENAAYYDSQIAALEKKKAENNKNAQDAMLNLQLQQGASVAAAAADGFRSLMGEQSAAYQTMFAVQKAFAIAQSMIAIQAAMASASWSLPFPGNLGAMATVASATANIVSSIMSVASPSFDGGGYTGNGSRSGGLDGKGGFWAMMHPQETVIDHTKSSGKGVSFGGSGNVTVNVSLQETSDTSKQGTTEQSTSDDGSVQISVFVSDIRSEGAMAQVLERTYGLTRMGA